MPQRVELELVEALGALAVEVVRLGDAVAVEQQHLHDLGAVVLGGEHDGRDVGRELGVVRARPLPERVLVAVEELLLVEDLVLGMLEDRLGDRRVAQVDGEQQRVSDLLAVRLGQQDLHDLHQHRIGIE